MTETKRSIFETAKKFTFFAIKIGISSALIIWLFKQDRLDFSSLNRLCVDIDTVVLFLCGAIFVFCGLLLLGLRLWLLLRFKRFRITFERVLGITLMGSFLGVILPGLVGGDAMKAVYLCSNVCERRMDALSSVFIDRVLGLYSLLLLGALALCAVWAVDSIPLDSSVLLAAPIVVVLLGLGMFLIAWDGFFNTRMVQILYLLIPKMIQHFLNALRGYLKAPRLIIMVVLISLLNHACVVGSFIIAAVLLNDNLPMFAHFIINPLAMLMNVIPITPGGVGMAESAFSFLFQAAGSPNGAMVGLLGRFIQYTVFILSGSIAILLLKMRGYIGTLEQGNSQYVVGREVDIKKEG